MATQQLYTLLGSKYPFGRGTSTVTYSSDPNTRRSCTASGNQVYLSNPAYTNDTVVLIHQTVKGTSSSQVNWELGLISSGGGTSVLTLRDTLSQNYTTGTQIIDVPEVSIATFNTLTGTAWDGSTGGLIVVAARTSITFSGTVNLNGGNGGTGSSDNSYGATGGGYRGGNNSSDAGNAGSGEGWNYTLGSWPNETTTNMGNGGGGSGSGGVGAGKGGSGGNSAAGTSGANGALGGDVAGSADLTSFFFGGGGGGGKVLGGEAGGGASGGGGFILWTKTLTVSGGLTANGGTGGTPPNINYGGHGAGGSILANCYQATLGSGLVTANGVTANGFSSGAGRVRINYSFSVSGTTSPTYSFTVDSQLRTPSSAVLFSG